MSRKRLRNTLEMDCMNSALTTALPKSPRVNKNDPVEIYEKIKMKERKETWEYFVAGMEKLQKLIPKCENGERVSSLDHWNCSACSNRRREILYKITKPYFTVGSKISVLIENPIQWNREAKTIEFTILSYEEKEQSVVAIATEHYQNREHSCDDCKNNTHSEKFNLKVSHNFTLYNYREKFAWKTNCDGFSSFGIIDCRSIFWNYLSKRIENVVKLNLPIHLTNDWGYNQTIYVSKFLKKKKYTEFHPSKSGITHGYLKNGGSFGIFVLVAPGNGETYYPVLLFLLSTMPSI